MFELVRVRLADNVPMCLETGYLPEHYFPRLLKYDLSDSLYKIPHSLSEADRPHRAVHECCRAQQHSSESSRDQTRQSCVTRTTHHIGHSRAPDREVNKPVPRGSLRREAGAPCPMLGPRRAHPYALDAVPRPPSGRADRSGRARRPLRERLQFKSPTSAGAGRTPRSSRKALH
jgi:hypothetical protein